MADYDPRINDSDEERLAARRRVREDREPRGVDQVEPERALGGLYLVLIVLAIVALAIALLVFIL